MTKIEYRSLSSEETEVELATIPGWTSHGDRISRTFQLDIYKDGLVFAVAVGYAADRLDHHPEITIGYKSVTVESSTHSTGGLSPFDFELARRIDALL